MSLGRKISLGVVAAILIAVVVVFRFPTAMDFKLTLKETSTGPYWTDSRVEYTATAEVLRWLPYEVDAEVQRWHMSADGKKLLATEGISDKQGFGPSFDLSKSLPLLPGNNRLRLTMFFQGSPVADSPLLLVHAQQAAWPLACPAVAPKCLIDNKILTKEAALTYSKVSKPDWQKLFIAHKDSQLNLGLGETGAYTVGSTTVINYHGILLQTTLTDTADLKAAIDAITVK